MVKVIHNVIGNKAVMSVILALVIIVTLILIPNGRAHALSIDITEPSPKMLGEVITFSTTVQIEDNELLPIQGVDLEIYKRDAPGTYKLTCMDLPLAAGLVTYPTAGGTVEVEATPAPSWAYGYGYRYAEWQGYGYSWGYGYGYGYQPGIGTTSITYNVTWYSLSTWPTGTYEVKLTVTADGDTFIQSRTVNLIMIAHFLTGGGHLNMDTIGKNGKKVALNFAGNVGFLSDMTITGQFQIVDHTVDKGSESWHCHNNFSSLVFSGDTAESPPAAYNTATFTGTFTSSRGNQMEATITISDLGEGKSGETDTITYSFDGSGPFGPFALDGGNFQVHEGYIGGDDQPDPPGGGGGGPDRSPPRISSVACFGITRGSSDICWTTHEKSTSQVEYWANSHEFSGINEALANNHNVQLTGLNPATTYHYRTISVDKSGNVAISEERSFTTIGEPASFKVKNLSIHPIEVDTDQEVAVGVTVSNTGDAHGKYEISLKVDGDVIESEEIGLDGHTSEEMILTISFDTPGTYDLDLNGLTGSLIVRVIPEAPASPTTTPVLPVSDQRPQIQLNWWLIGLMLSGCLVIGLSSYFIWRRKRIG